MMALVLATVDAIPTPTATVARTAGEVLKKRRGRMEIGDNAGAFWLPSLRTKQATRSSRPRAAPMRTASAVFLPILFPRCASLFRRHLSSARPQLPTRGSISARNIYTKGRGRAVEDDNFSDRRAVWASRSLTLSSLGHFVVGPVARRRRRRGRTAQGSPSLEDWR